MNQHRIILSKRLKAAADMVRHSGNVCDVGTDHGYLAAYLVQNDIAKGCIACDINKKPLEAARKTLVHAGVYGRVELVLSDGLKEVALMPNSDIIICGMGGELIAKIISEYPYKENSGTRFILGPMSKENLLRQYLCENGFAILDETPVEENGHAYSVMLAEYSGKPCRPSRLFLLIGRVAEKQGNDRDFYLEKKLFSLERNIAGLKQSATKDESRIAELEALRGELIGCMANS